MDTERHLQRINQLMHYRYRLINFKWMIYKTEELLQNVRRIFVDGSIGYKRVREKALIGYSESASTYSGSLYPNLWKITPIYP